VEILTGERIGARAPLRLTVGCVLRDAEGRVLLMRRSDNGLWGLPGGGVEPGESVAEAVAREVYEETGLTIRPRRLVGVYSDPNRIVRYADGNEYQPVALNFLCELVEGTPRPSDEALAVEWFPADALPDDLLWVYRQRLADALADTPAAAIR
jgi:ADP-ribose pyrophosphatase YjhB (NUDIX family)